MAFPISAVGGDASCISSVYYICQITPLLAAGMGCISGAVAKPIKMGSGPKIRLHPVWTEAELAAGDNRFWVDYSLNKVKIKYSAGNIATDGTIVVESYASDTQKNYVINVQGASGDRYDRVIIDGSNGGGSLIFEGGASDYSGTMSNW